MRIFWSPVAAVSALLFAGLTLTAHAQRNGAQIQPESQVILRLANEARAAAGLRPLQWDGTLAAAARVHCLRMVAEGPIAHQYKDEPELSERAGKAGAEFSLIEENVALGPDVAGIHAAWMRSPGHRANLLNPDVDRVGVAVVSGRNGLYAVADYAREAKAMTRDEIELSVAGLLRTQGVSVASITEDARRYCAEGQTAALATRPTFRMMWQDSDLTHLPQSLVELLATGKHSQAAVGSCPAQHEQNGFTGYRVAVLLY